MNELKIVGKPEAKIDAIDKVTGSARFVDDICLPGMLWGAVLRSPYPHAKILNIDTSKAVQLPGVRAVITAADTPMKKYLHMGPALSDKLPLQSETVRYIGDEIAAVAAVDKETALEAIKLIGVDYQELPAVFDPEQAMKDEAVQIHQGKANNIGATINWNFGNVDYGFEISDLILEDRFLTPAQSHCILEPHGTVASFSSDGRLTIWTSTQSPYFIRKELAHVLDMDEHDVRIMETHSAGGFGARSKVCDDEAIAAFLARKTGCPVKVVLSRDEEMCTTRIRHPYIIYLKTGFSADGKLLARQIKAIVDNGAYNHYGAAIMGFSGMASSSLYRVANVRYEGNLVYTNKQFGGPYRGFGNPQVTFAIESHMDEAARRLGIDPVEIRLLNCTQPGDTTANGWKITSCGMKECIEAAKKQIDWDAPKQAGRGKGIACLIHAGGGSRTFPDGDYSASIIQVSDKGKINLFTGVSDTGTYITTVLCQIASEILSVQMSDIHCFSMDTLTTPTDFGSWASKTAFLAGNAVKLAAEDAKKQLMETAAEILDEQPSNLVFVNGTICSLNHKKCISIGEAVIKCPSKVGRFIIGRGHYESPTEMLDRATGFANVSAAYSFAAHAVEVEIDKKTGRVNIIKLVAAHDVGRALNLNAVEGQLDGSIAQGIGFALYEEQMYQNGRVLTSHLRDHRPLTFTDMPAIETIIIETCDPEGPFGAKGVGEPGTVPVAAAIAAAVYDAVGVRIKELPIKPERLLASIKKQG